MNNFKRDVNKINVPEKKLDNVIRTAMKTKKKQMSLSKKIAYFSTAAVLFLSLIFSSAFVSPVMANVMSDIPYIGSVFEPRKDLTQVIGKKFEEKGYKIDYISTSYNPQKTIEIGINGSEKYFDKINNDVKNTVNHILQSKEYNAYTVKLTNQETEPVKKDPFKENSKGIGNIIDTLGKRDIEVVAYGVSDDSKTIHLKIDVSKEHFDKTQETIHDVVSSSPLSDYEVEVKRQNDVKVTWANQIVPTISDELMSKKGYHVTNVSYSTEPKKIIVNTSENGTDAYEEKLGKGIERTVKKILKSEEVNTDVVKIKVYNKDHKIIN